MALIRCQECGKEISDKANQCPNCGFPIQKNNKCKLCGREIEIGQEVCKKCINDYKIPQNSLQNDGFTINMKETASLNEENKKTTIYEYIALVLSIFSLLLGCCNGYIGILLSIMSILFAYVQFKKTNNRNNLIVIIVVSIIAILISIYSIGRGQETDTGNDTRKETVTTSNPTKNNENTKENLVEEKKLQYQKKEIYNKNKCIISLVDGDEENITLQIDNKSKKDYNFCVHSMSINGYMTNCNIYTGSCDVPSKKRGTMEIAFESDWLKNVTDIKYIDLIIWAYDDDNNMKDFETNKIRIKTNLFDKEEKFKKGKNSKETNGLIISVNSIDTETANISIINTNNYYVEFDMDNASINDLAFEPGYSVHGTSVSLDGIGIVVFPNSIANIDVNLSEFTEKNNISQIENIEFSLKVREKGDYFKEEKSKKINFKF